MNLKTFLLFSAALLVWILASKVYMLLYYWAVLLVLVSYLNSKPLYKRQPYRWINLLFFLYITFIVWERTRPYKFSKMAEMIINDVEHILFAVIISLLVGLMLSLTFAKIGSYAKIISITVVIFNIIGVVNECFQNILVARPVFAFIPDSQKDMLMNVLGSIVFIALALVVEIRKRPKLSGH